MTGKAPHAPISVTQDLSPRVTEKELARHWRTTERTLQRWRADGSGPPWIRIGGRILYTREDVLEFESERCSGKGGDQ